MAGSGQDAGDPLTQAPQSSTPGDSEDVTRFSAGDDALTIAAPLSDVGLTIAAPSDHAMTIAAVSDSLADAMTVAAPVTPTAQRPRPSGGRSESGPLEVGQSFGPRYHIIRMLGVGGMGAVYQAWDSELGVAVAIKVIRPEVLEDPVMAEEVSRRFKRELLLARQVTHKNVVRIHDLGDIDGIKYITMSYVEGTDLSTILKRDGKRPVRELLCIARAIVGGLVAAHTAGVVHRDLKPANIMIGKDGEALIMDFGIAHSTGDAGASPPTGTNTIPEHLRRAAAHSAGTTVGAIVGTLEYMAPEQARGETIDQRVDIYAFGLILYDAYLGQRRAASGGSAVDELQRRMTSPPPPLQALAADVPAPLAALIARCVEPDAAKRFQTSAEVAAELDRLDEDGQLIPVKRTVGLPQMAAVIAVLTVVFGGAWWYFREPAVVTHEQVSVLIADLDNRTGDADFDRTLEPMLKRALEDTGFITAFNRTSLRDIGVRPPETLTQADAMKMAVNQGLRVVLGGVIEPRQSGYRISITATQPVTNEVITTSDDVARSRNDVVATATKLMARVREALGDETVDAGPQGATGGLTTASLDVVRLYASALEATANNRFDDASGAMVKAVSIDPDFGIGYLFLSVLSRNTGKLDDQNKYLADAVSHLSNMTERERFTTRAFSSLASGDYQGCVDQLTEQLKKYPAAITGRNQLALCRSYLRDLKGAVADQQLTVKLMPNQLLYRDNLALFAAYASDFRLAEQEANAVESKAPRPDRYAALALALAQLGRGDLTSAKATYERMAKMPRGASLAASGLGDIAILEGRFSDAVSILRTGAAADLKDENPDPAASKLVGAAYAELSRGQKVNAVSLANEALQHSTAVKVRFMAARIFVEAGDEARARAVADGLAKEVYKEPRAYATTLQGLLQLRAGNAVQAMDLLREANNSFTTWLGLFDLGRASFDAGIYSAADSAFDACVNARRGEALAVFVDEEPTAGYLAQAFYYLGRSREQLKDKRYAEPYLEYVRLRGASKEDSLLSDVRQRAARASSGG